MNKEHPATRKPQVYAQAYEEIRVAEMLVSAARYMLNRPELRLIIEPESYKGPAKTDLTNIHIPIRHPNKPIVTRHELAHIFFGSDMAMAHRFYTRYLKDRSISDRSGQIIDSILYAVNVFDDFRVNNLWGQLYPGSGIRMRHWYGDIVAPQILGRLQDAPHSIFDCMIVVGFDLPIPPDSQWKKDEQEIAQLHADTISGSFEGLVVRLAEFLVRLFGETPPPSAVPAWRNGLATPRKAAKPKSDITPYLPDRTASFKPTDKVDNPPESRLTPTTLYSQYKKDGAATAEGYDDKLDERIQAAEKRKTSSTPGGGPRCGPPSVVVEQRVSRDDSITDEPDWAVVASLRRRLRQIHMRADYQLEEEGAELDCEAYLQQRLSHTPPECFRNPVNAAGFTVYLLVDLSASMRDFVGTVGSLFRTLAEGFKLPGVRVVLRGFQGVTQDGWAGVRVVNYDDNVRGLRSHDVNLRGYTPLHHAITQVAQQASRSGGRKMMLIVTDGLPNDIDLGEHAPYPDELVFNWVREALSISHRRGLTAHCLVLGTPDPDPMKKMFGSHWTALEAGSLQRVAVSLVELSYRRGLR